MKKSKVYLKMFLSYIGILLIPVAIGAFIYTDTSNIIKMQADKMNENLLEMVQRDFDRQVEEVYKVSSRLAMDTSIQLASRVKEKFGKEDQLMLYYLVSDLKNINVSEESIKDVFVYFNNTQTVSSIQGNMSAELYYHLYYEGEAFDFNDFRDYMSQFHYNDTLNIHKSNGRDILLFTMTNVDSTIGERSATIGIAVDFSVIKKNLNAMRWSDKMDILIVNSKNEAVSSKGAAPREYGLEYEQLVGKSQLVREYNGERCVVSVRESESIDWKYVTVVPMFLFEKEAERIRTIALIGLFTCILAGSLISYYMTKKNYNPLKNLMETFKNHGHVEIGENENEYQWLNGQMNQFFKEHINAERLLNDSRKSMRTYYLSQLLQYGPDEKGREAQYGIRMDGSHHLVVLFLPDSEAKKEDCDSYTQENALRKFVIINVFEELVLNYFNIQLVEMGERVAAVIDLPGADIQYVNTVKGLIEDLQQVTEERFSFSFTALMGSACRELYGIHTSCQQAEGLEEYIPLLDTNLIVYDDLKNIQSDYEYPAEMEQKIINAIKTGDSKQAGAYLSEVFADNLGRKVSVNSYHRLTFDMISTLLKGANQGGYSDAAKELDFPDSVTVKYSAAELEARFKELLTEICGRILAKQQEAELDHSLSREVEAYIKEHYQDPDLNISITSQQFDITPAYLSSIYKKQTGKSLLDYINTVRIEHAQQLLEEGYSVVEAAQMSGFRDSGTFIRAFKKKRGVTPGQIKKKF